MSRVTAVNRVSLALLVLVLLPLGSGQATEKQSPTIAIIIDDLGVEKAMGQRLAEIEAPLTLAFLPYRPHTEKLADLAQRNGKEIMLHAPMANMARIGLGPGGLDIDMSAEEISEILSDSLTAVPHATGVNNHMGSLLTQEEEPMRWVMDELARHKLYFIDSRTTETTVAADTAESRNVPAMSRDVFLDNERSREAIDRQFRLLLEKARENGTAIGIGHPHEETVAYLEEVLPKLDEYGYGVATVSGIWSMRHDNQPLFREVPVPLNRDP